jgi:lipid-A-disaccharide synthase
LPGIPRLKREIMRYLETHQPDAVVLCDWGAFNVRLAKILQPFKVPILYYFPPRSWQKTGDGGLGIVPLVNRIATPFEWSAKRLQNAGGNAEWVGHPLLEIVEETRGKYSRAATRRELGAGDAEFLIAILPGSRAGELKFIAPHLAGAMRRLEEKFPEKLRFVVAVPSGAKERVRAHFSGTLICEDRTTEVLLACDAAMVKSGTVTLEAAVCDAPQVVVYDVSPVVSAQVHLLGLHKKVPFVAMPNIILGRGAIPELLGTRCRPATIAEEMSALIENSNAGLAMRQEYSRVREALGANLPYTATLRTADILDEMLSASRIQT